MTSTPVGPDAVGNARGSGQRTAAVVAAAIAVAIVAVVAVAHAVRGGTKAASSMSAASSMNTTSKAGSSMTGGTSVSSSSSAMGSSQVMTIKQTALPMMQASGAMPVAMAMVPLGQSDWDGMTIAARTSAPASFILFDGTTQKMVRPTAKNSFHLMVLLSDKATGYAIPYSSVWATVKKGDKVVFDERLWPMISRYMGPHYGNNVSLPSAGTYHLSLLVSPPAAARHLEYDNLWLKPHMVNLTFRWVPKV